MSNTNFILVTAHSRHRLSYDGGWIIFLNNANYEVDYAVSFAHISKYHKSIQEFTKAKFGKTAALNANAIILAKDFNTSNPQLRNYIVITKPRGQEIHNTGIIEKVEICE